MDDLIGLFVLIGIAAGIFGAGFYLGYRYRDNLSVQRHRKDHRRPSAGRETPRNESPPASP
jgi:hypothetical protein